MTLGATKWAYFAVAVLLALVAGLSAVPYGWAHIAASAVSAAVGAFSALTGIGIHIAAGKGST